MDLRERPVKGPSIPGALGTIEPPEEQRPHIWQRLHALEKDPSPFRVPVDPSHLPLSCIDGRLCHEGLPFWSDAPPAGHALRETGPARTTARVPGGTALAWVADLLTTRAFHPHNGLGSPDPLPRETLGEDLRDLTPAWLSILCSTLRTGGFHVWAHTGPSVSASDCGCGAIDNLGTELGLIAQAPPALIDLVNSWGLDMRDLPDEVPRRCAHLSTTLPEGAGIVGILAGWADTPLPHASGKHCEVALLVNTCRGTTIDSHKACAALMPSRDPHRGDNVGVFVIDTWVFEDIADFLLRNAAGHSGSVSSYSRQELVTVMAAFTAATVLTLCGPQLPLSVLR